MFGYITFPNCFTIAVVVQCSNFTADPENTLENSKNDELKVGSNGKSSVIVKTEKGYAGIEARLTKKSPRKNKAVLPNLTTTLVNTQYLYGSCNRLSGRK